MIRKTIIRSWRFLSKVLLLTQNETQAIEKLLRNKTVYTNKYVNYNDL